MKCIADDGDKRGFAGAGKECQSLSLLLYAL